METAVGRIVIFGSALGAHRKLGHGSFGAVVGQVTHDGEARPAIGAIDEGVMVAAVLRIEQLFHAGIAGGQIGRHQRGLTLCSIFGKANLEFVEALYRHFLDLDFTHLGCSWLFLRKGQHEPVKRQGFAFGVNFHALDVVQNPAGNIAFFCLTIGKGAETHPLYYARYF